MSDDPRLRGLRGLPTPPLPDDRRRAVGLRAGDAFEAAHRERVWLTDAARVALTVVLTGAAALYLLWAMRVAHTFG